MRTAAGFNLYYAARPLGIFLNRRDSEINVLRRCSEKPFIEGPNPFLNFVLW